MSDSPRKSSGHVRFGSFSALQTQFSRTAASGREADVIEAGFRIFWYECQLAPKADILNLRNGQISRAAYGQKRAFITQTDPQILRTAVRATTAPPLCRSPGGTVGIENLVHDLPHSLVDTAQQLAIHDSLRKGCYLTEN